jgi:hypothetical protein
MKSIKPKILSLSRNTLRAFFRSRIRPKFLLKFFALTLVSFLTLLVGGFFVFLLADNSTAGYQQKIEACIAARLPSGAGPKSITDYICPEGQVVAPHDVAYQVVLDLEFRKIDQEIQKELLAFQ